MTCTFFKTQSPAQKIKKELTNSIDATCDIINDTTILTPVIIVDSSFINYNYVYIPDFNRYYFVTNTIIKNNMIELCLKVDVLYTYKDEILKNKQYISRCEDYKFTNVRDDLLQVTEKKYIKTVKLTDDIFSKNIKFVLGVR